MKLVAMTVLCVDFYENQGMVCVGGNSVNFAVQCTKEHVESVSLLGAIGDDGWGQDILRFLEGFPIDGSHVHRKAGRTASNRILIDAQGERSFPEHAWDGGVYQDFLLSEEDWEFVLGHEVIAIPANNINYRETIRRRRPHQMVTVDFLDLREYSLMDQTIPFIDLAFISGDEEVLAYARSLSPRVSTPITVTLGAQGSVCFHRGRETHVAAVPVPEVKDTTGCGDAYQAAFTVSYWRNRSIEEAMTAGSRAAAEILRHIGAVS